jgi:CheY-like chemotaxis protein
MPSNSRRSMTLNVCDWTEPFSAAHRTTATCFYPGNHLLGPALACGLDDRFSLPPFRIGALVAAILVVEDEAQVLLLAESYLEEHGHKTLSAATVTQASAIIESDQPLDLLFTDIGLGDDLQAGLDLARAAVGRRPGLKVLYATGQTVTDGMKALFVEGSAVLAKPYTVDELLTNLSVLSINHPDMKPKGGG